MVGGKMACDTLISGAILPERAASMYLGGREPVISDPVAHDQDLVEPAAVFRYPVDTDRWLDGITDATNTAADGFWIPQSAHYAGHHFGGKAVLPGIRQVGALKYLAQYHSVEVNDNVFRGVQDVEFKRPILPGERLDLHVELMDSTERYSGLVRVGGEIACEATLLFVEAA
jgi:3-hydroxymyristoyl/3-hydroxydecanoyl-(acyl carrier protein) dehydratase